MGEIVAHLINEKNITSSLAQVPFLRKKRVENMSQFTLCCGIYRQRINPEDQVKYMCSQREYSEKTSFLCGAGRTRNLHFCFLG